MKTKLINRLIVLAGTLVFAFAFMAFISPQDGQKKGAPWEIPSKYAKMENPYANEDLAKVGKMLYSKHCKSCHGNKGLGDGPKAKQLETFPGDFTSEAFQSGTDGELYYKSFVGRDEMPNYEKKITDEEDRWAIINYLRTLK